MLSQGNTAANSVWEAAVPDNVEKPAWDAPSEEKETWIRNKYEHKQFLGQLLNDPVANLCSTIKEVINWHSFMAAVARCPREDVSGAGGRENGKTALHMACELGHSRCVQLLLWAFADPNAVDAEGRTPLYCKSLPLSILC